MWVKVFTAEPVAYDLSSLQSERSVSVTRQADLINHACLGVAQNNNPSVGTPLSDVLKLGTELGETYRHRAFVLGKIEVWLSIGFNYDTRRWIVDGDGDGAGQLGHELIDDFLQGTKSWLLCSATDANDVFACRTIVALLEDGLRLVWAGSSL